VKVWVELLKRNEWKGLTLCQSGSSFGFAAKIAFIPILAASTLPGGAVGAGGLLSAAGLSGLLGAPVGGYVTDRIGAKGAAVFSGIVSSIGLVLIPVTLQIAEDGSSAFPGIELAIGGVLLETKALYFSLAVLLWSLSVSAQGPALIALAQERSLPGVEATSLSLMKAAGDGTYIVAPFLLGLVADALTKYPGIECLLAGSTTLLGTAALAVLVEEGESLK
jgi:MFS family permease